MNAPFDPPAVPWSRALVVGLGTSGRAAAKLLVRCGVAVNAYDRHEGAAQDLEGVRPFAGETIADEAFEGIDVLVLSPGVPPSEPRRQARALAPKAEVHGELSLALDLWRRSFGDIDTVLITGTNGKSTVTALCGALLAEAGRRPFVGGNLGEPLADRLLGVFRGEPAPDVLVLECSSYQLETLDAHPTSVAMVLNVTPDHLDRYRDLEDYATTKARIFAGLGAGSLALLGDCGAFDALVAEAIPRGASRVDVGAGHPVHVAPETLVVDPPLQIPLDAVPLAGRHNQINALFAVRAALHLGVEASACEAGLRAFEGLPHRMQRVGERAGVRFFDDSKATNVAAVLAGLAGFDRRFVLVAGGRAKGDDLAPLAELLREGGRAAVTLGEAAEALEAAIGEVVPVRRAHSMAEAVRLAAELAEPGDAVVLSPACASFDMFPNYAARGRAFAEAFQALD